MVLLIYGASGLAKEVYDIVIRSTPNKYEKIIFIDDFEEETSFYLSERIHFDSAIRLFNESLDSVEGIVAVGEPAHRELLAEKFALAGIRLAKVIDKSAIISPTAIIDEGCIICEYSSIHANAHICKGAMVQPFCCVGHDIVLGEYSVMSATCTPGGASTFGRRVYMGMNASSIEKIDVGDDAIIGMGAAVFRNVDAGSTVIGNPARATRGNDQHRVFS